MAARKAAVKESTSLAQSGDAIDRARHYWREQGYGEGEDDFLAMSSLLRFHRLVTVVVEDVLKKHKLNLTDYTILMSLQLSRTQPISRLARGLLINSTTATLATDRLAQRGLIERKPHPTDRRTTLISISAKGRTLIDKATEALKDSEFGFGGTDIDDRGELIGLLARLRMAAGDFDETRAVDQ
jgi:DNA-binding MarR family transcriptional regulator